MDICRNLKKIITLTRASFFFYRREYDIQQNPRLGKGEKVQQEHWSVHKSTRASDVSASTPNHPKNMYKIGRKLFMFMPNFWHI